MLLYSDSVQNICGVTLFSRMFGPKQAEVETMGDKSYHLSPMAIRIIIF